MHCSLAEGRGGWRSWSSKTKLPAQHSSQHSTARACRAALSDSWESTTPEGCTLLGSEIRPCISPPSYVDLSQLQLPPEAEREGWESSQGLPAPHSHTVTHSQHGGRAGLFLLPAELASPFTSAPKQHTAQLLILLGVWGQTITT